MADDQTPKPEAGKETYDDRPFHMDNLPPEIRAPLAPLQGQEAPQPAWFKAAIADEPERRLIDAEGGRIELLTWGEIGKPGLLLVHGNSAHADWWSFVAPYLAKDYRVAAMSLAGMGGSDWRERYSFDAFAHDAEAAARAGGLYEGGRKPIYIGHSFGGGQVYFAAAKYPEQMHAAVLVDTGFGGPPPAVLADRAKREAEGRRQGDRGGRVYATFEEALTRFRLMPPQPCDNLYILDFIARRSLKRAPMPDGSGEGWTWKFDSTMWEKLDRGGMGYGAERPRPQVPTIHIYGDKSLIVQRRAKGEPHFLDGIPEVEIPESHHHVMLDQPLALVAALRTLLARWPA